MKRSDMITKKDFILRGEWSRPNYNAPDRYYYYWIYADSEKWSKKARLQRVNDKKFSSKRDAETYLGGLVRVLNKIKSGEYAVIDGKAQKAPTKENE